MYNSSLTGWSSIVPVFREHILEGAGKHFLIGRNDNFRRFLAVRRESCGTNFQRRRSACMGNTCPCSSFYTRVSSKRNLIKSVAKMPSNNCTWPTSWWQRISMPWPRDWARRSWWPWQWKMSRNFQWYLWVTFSMRRVGPNKAASPGARDRRISSLDLW